MPLPDNINIDKLIFSVLIDLKDAYNGWLGGVPRDEVTLMSRITERLSRNRQDCDVGVSYPVTMEAELFELHRKGRRQVDKFGADLAVTVRIPDSNWLKTSFIQFKVASKKKTTLNSTQLRQSTQFPGLSERSFVVVVDQESTAFHIKSTSRCLSAIHPSFERKVFDVSRWQLLGPWLRRWFNCEEGKSSVASDPNSVEAMLEEYVVISKTLDESKFLGANFPKGGWPAKAWLDVSLIKPGG